MICKHCLQRIFPCADRQCQGPAGAGCGGWVHYYGMFHSCLGGHQAEPPKEAGMSESQHETDVMHPAQRVYTMAVVAADHEYRATCRAAWEKRQKAIDEALETCLTALQEREKPSERIGS